MRRLFLLMLLSMMPFTGCTQQASQSSSEILELSNRWEEALNAGDLESLLAVYAEDCRVLPPNAELGSGHEAVTASFGPAIEGNIQGELETIESMVALDIGYQIGTYIFKSEGGEVIDRGKFVEVWKKVNGEWKIGNDIWNSDLEPGSGTTTLLATHEVNDFEQWIAAWRGADSRHQMFAQHGAPKMRTFQSAADPNLTGVLIEVADMEAFQSFMDSPEVDAAKAEDGVQDATLRLFNEVE